MKTLVLQSLLLPVQPQFTIMAVATTEDTEVISSTPSIHFFKLAFILKIIMLIALSFYAEVTQCHVT